MNKWAIALGSAVVVVAGVGMGIGAIKVYQLANPVSDTHAALSQSVAPKNVVEVRRAACGQPGVRDAVSKPYGDVTRIVVGSTRQSSSFQAIAQVIQADPFVVLSIDTSSVQDKDSFLFDSNRRKLPTLQVVVTDSSVGDLRVGDIIDASIEYSSPKNGDAMMNPSPEDLETVVKLQGVQTITDTAKQGVFASDFVLLELPMGVVLMASGDVYSYALTTDTTSGIADVRKVRSSGDVDSVATQLATIKGNDTSHASVSHGYLMTACGRAVVSSDGKLAANGDGVVATVVQSLLGDVQSNDSTATGSGQ